MPENNSFFPKRKRRAASGRTRTRGVLRSRQMFYQLSHRGSSVGQAEWRLSSDKQGYSTCTCRCTNNTYVRLHPYVHAHLYSCVYKGMYVQLCIYRQCMFAYLMYTHMYIHVHNVNTVPTCTGTFNTVVQGVCVYI